MAGTAQKCPTCGAPLRWKGDATVVECRYCHTHVHAESGAATDAAATVVSQAKFPTQIVILVAVIIPAIAGALGIGIASMESSGSSTPAVNRVPLSAIAAIDLAITPDQLRKRLRAPTLNDPNRVHVEIDDPIYRHAHFSWESGHLEHVHMVSLNAATDAELPRDTRRRVQKQLGREFRPALNGGHAYSGYGVNLSLGESSFYINAHQQGPGWKDRLGALWIVMKNAALGSDETLTEKAKRDILNIGYPLERIGAVRVDVTVDGARNEVTRVIPGAQSEAESHRVGVEHPWVELADLRWANEAGGKLQIINLFYPPDFELKAQREDIERCLTPLLGPPNVIERDHLAGEVDLTFKGRGGIPAIMVHDQHFAIHMQAWAAPQVTQAGFEKVIRALSACGS